MKSILGDIYCTWSLGFYEIQKFPSPFKNLYNFLFLFWPIVAQLWLMKSYHLLPLFYENSKQAFQNNCPNPNSTTTQSSITYVGFDVKSTLHITTIHHEFYAGNISALTFWFWPNLKGSFPGPSLTIGTSQFIICPGSIYPGVISPAP